MSEKQKLTLSVNKEVVDRAKELGINISEITENVLRGFTFSPKDFSDEDFYEQYNSLFHTMLPLLKKYNFTIQVARDDIFDEDGDFVDSFDIYLETNGLLCVVDVDAYIKDIKALDVNQFLEPMEILSNFITSLSKSVEARRENLRELEMAKRIIEAISNTIDEKSYV